MSHANARLNLYGRRLLVSRVVQDGRPVAHVAKSWVSRVSALTGGSPGTARAGDAGLSGPLLAAAHSARDELRSRSSSGCCSCDATSGAVRSGSCRARRAGHDRLGAILRRHQVPLSARVRPAHRRGDPRQQDHDAALRTPAPGDLIHIDVKKIGRIPDGGGWRAHGRSEDVPRPRRSATTTSTPRSTTTPGSPTPRSSTDETGPTCASFLPASRAASSLSHGITVREIITDNARNYTVSHDFKPPSAAIGARHLTIQPSLSLAERQGRTVQPHPPGRVGLSPRLHHQPPNAAQALDPWLDYYNTQRPHSALGGLPPISRLS